MNNFAKNLFSGRVSKNDFIAYIFLLSFLVVSIEIAVHYLGLHQFILVPLAIVFFILVESLCVRRAHDLGKAWLWIYAPENWLLFGGVLLDGQPFPNQYGEVPKQKKSLNEFLVGLIKS